MKNTNFEENENTRDVMFELITPNVARIPLYISESTKEQSPNKNGTLSELHFHDEIEILNVIAGQMQIVLGDGASLTVKGGEAICINRRVLHSTFVKELPLKVQMLQFRDDRFSAGGENESLQKYLLRISRMQNEPIYLTDDPSFTALVKSIFREQRAQEKAYEMFISSHIYSILGHLYRCRFFADPAEHIDLCKLEKILPALEYIDEHYAKSISLAQISAIAGLSEYHFCHLCKEVTGGGFVEYLNFVRISRADRLLRKTDMSILEIAGETGFSSLPYFNRIFKRFRGCPPSLYRRTSRVKG